MKLLCKPFLLAAFLMAMSWTSPTLADDTLIFASREKTITNRFAELVLSEAYDRLNINIEFAIYPDARSVEEANEGRADGEVARLASVLTRYTNLKLVPVPLFHSELSAFVHDRYEMDISDWQSLKAYSLTTVRGFEYVQHKLEGSPFRTVATAAKAIQMVEDDLVEVAVLNRFLGLLAIAKTGAKNVKPHDPPLARLPAFHLLHKKHADLIPKVTAVLKEMEQDGVIRSMWEDFITRKITRASQ